MYVEISIDFITFLFKEVTEVNLFSWELITRHKKDGVDIMIYDKTLTSLTCFAAFANVKGAGHY